MGNISSKEAVMKMNQLEMLGMTNTIYMLKWTGRFTEGLCQQASRREKMESIGGKLRGVKIRKRSVFILLSGVLERQKKGNGKKIFD